MASRSVYRFRLLACTAAFCLVATACGGGDSDGLAGDGDSSSSPGPADIANSDTSNSDTSSSDSPDAGTSGGADGGAGAGPQRSVRDIVEFDSTALSTTALDVSVLNYSERQQAAPSVEPVVDTCAALPAGEVVAIASDIADRFGLDQAAPAGDPCSLWSQAELEAFFMGTPFGAPNSSEPNSCA